MSHFTVAELTHSDTAIRKGIDNTPDADVLANIYILINGLEKVREALGHPMRINSGYRSPKLNAAIGGAKTSSHMKGLAADFTCSNFGTPLDICRHLVTTDIPYHQLIQEGTWVHIAFPDVDELPKREVLTAHFTGGKVSYTKGLA